MKDEPIHCPFCFDVLSLSAKDLAWKCRFLISTGGKRRIAELASEAAEASEASAKGLPLKEGEVDEDAAWHDDKEPEPWLPKGEEDSPYCGEVYTWGEGNSCPRCQTSKNRAPICLHCRATLPSEWLSGNRCSTGIVGTTGAGKDAFLVALYEEFQRRLADLGMSYEFAGDEDRQKQDLDRLIHDGFQTANTPTELGLGRAEQVFLLKIIRESHGTDSFFGKLNRMLDGGLSEPFFVHFKNNPGEVFADAKKMAGHAPYLLGSKGLIIILNPLRLAIPVLDKTDFGAVVNREELESLEQMAPAARKRYHSANFEIVQTLTSFLREFGPVKNGKITTPVAICLNKWDLIKRKYDQPTVSPVDRRYSEWVEKNSPRSASYCDERACIAHSEAVKRFLRKQADENRIVNHIEINFHNSAFFAISCKRYDTGKDQDAQFAHVSVRIMDVFNWLLFKLKLVAGKA